jgi:hypothetical protein
VPSRMGVSGRYFSVPSSARSPADISTGVVCVWKPAGQRHTRQQQERWKSAPANSKEVAYARTPTAEGKQNSSKGVRQGHQHASAQKWCASRSLQADGKR